MASDGSTNLPPADGRVSNAFEAFEALNERYHNMDKPYEVAKAAAMRWIETDKLFNRNVSRYENDLKYNKTSRPPAGNSWEEYFDRARSLCQTAAQIMRDTYILRGQALPYAEELNRLGHFDTNSLQRHYTKHQQCQGSYDAWNEKVLICERILAGIRG